MLQYCTLGQLYFMVKILRCYLTGKVNTRKAASKEGICAQKKWAPLWTFKYWVEFFENSYTYLTIAASIQKELVFKIKKSGRHLEILKYSISFHRRPQLAYRRNRYSKFKKVGAILNFWDTGLKFFENPFLAIAASIEKESRTMHHRARNHFFCFLCYALYNKFLFNKLQINNRVF